VRNAHSRLTHELIPVWRRLEADSERGRPARRSAAVQRRARPLALPARLVQEAPGHRELFARKAECRLHPHRWTPRILALDNAMARLAAHEIDHLSGILYTSRMRQGTQPIPVAEYRRTGHAWTYPADGQANAGQPPR
jgi:hypothetical protein